MSPGGPDGNVLACLTCVGSGFLEDGTAMYKAMSPSVASLSLHGC